MLDNVNPDTLCVFILPDKKLEKESKDKKLINNNRLKKIMKLPENVFSEGRTTSIFIFEAAVPQNEKEVFTCYIQKDGLITVKNQGRQNVNDKWGELKDYWVDVINKQSGDETIKWVNPKGSLSYQSPKRV